MRHIAGLEKHAELQKDLQNLEKRIQNWGMGKCAYKDVSMAFQKTLEYIIDEMKKEHPQFSGSNLDESIGNMRSRSVITESSADLFGRVYMIGKSGAGSDPGKHRSYSEISSVYNELLAYIPNFLQQYPEPSTKPMPEAGVNHLKKTVENEKREKERKEQQEDKYATREIRIERRNAAKQKYRRRRAGIMALILVALIIIAVVIAVMIRNNNQSARANSENKEVVEEEENALLTSGEGEAINEEEADAEEDDLAQTAVKEKTATESGASEETAAGDEENDTNGEAADGNEDSDTEKHYSMGETWTVDGQWELTIEGVTATPYSDNDGSWLIVIDYLYKNLGYENSFMGGLYISLSSDARIIDANGVLAIDFNSVSTGSIIYPQTLAVGGTWEAKQQFHILSNVNSAVIDFSKGDGNNTEQSAVFDISW